MIQLVVNTNLLREIDERKLINAYARLYDSEEDLTNNINIQENLTKLLDWDINGDSALGIYCGKFESIKSRDWEVLIQFIKGNGLEIKDISKKYIGQKKLESIKIINDYLESKEKRNIERFSDKNYKVSGRGRKAKSCIYEGREYKSRQECMYKENITKNELYKYLERTGQV